MKPLICLVMLLFSIPMNDLHAFSNVNTSFVNSEIQRVRIDVTTTTGYTRHLLLGFTPDNAATDGFDYGYDAINIDDFSNDCNWIIEDNRCVIQGVGAFHESKTYPLGLFLSDAGNVEFSLLSLENFNQPIEVYIYDAQSGEVNSISDSSFTEDISEGNHLNRFYVTFTNDISLMNFSNSQLSVDAFDLKSTKVSYIASTNELRIEMTKPIDITSLAIYNILGQKTQHWNNISVANSGITKVSLSNISEGTYIAHILTPIGKISKRLIIAYK